MFLADDNLFILILIELGIGFNYGCGVVRAKINVSWYNT